MTLFDFLSLIKEVNVASKCNKQINCVKKVNDENSRIRIHDPDPGSGSESESGSISQRLGSAYPDPDPPQNVMDPQHWLIGSV